MLHNPNNLGGQLLCGNRDGVKTHQSHGADMTKPHGPYLNCNITQERIDTAKRANSAACPAANALGQDYPHFRHISADIQTIRWTDPAKGLRYIALTPRVLQQFILDIDQGKDPEPLSCQIRPGQIVQAGARKAKEPPNSLEPLTTKKRKYRRYKLTKPGGDNDRTGRVPIIVGGRPPPKGPPQMSNRREFGIRSYR